MVREACWRHDVAYLVSWRRVTHLEWSLRWGNKSRLRAICATNPFRYRSELCIHWPCRQNCARNHEPPTPVTDSVARPTPAARRSNGPAVRRAAHAPPRSSPPMRRSAVGGRRSAVGGRRPAGETRCVAFGRDSVSAHFQFQTQNITKFGPPWRNKGV